MRATCDLVLSHLDITLNSTKIFLASPKWDDPLEKVQLWKIQGYAEKKNCKFERIAVNVPLCKKKNNREKPIPQKYI